MPAHTRRVALLLVAAAFGLQVLALLGASQCDVGGLQDEGYVLECSSRMLSGELPYRDFETRFMPATNWVLNVVFQALGENVFAARLYFVAMAAFLAAALQWFSMRLLPRGWSELPTLLFLCLGVQAWPMVSFHWDATIFTLLALGLLVHVNPRTLLAAGALCGVTVLFLESKGLATCLGCGFMLLMHPGPLRNRLRNLGLLIAGATIPGALFVLWLMAHGLVGAFFENVVGFTASRYLVLHRAPLDFSPLVENVTVLGQGLSTFNQTNFLSWIGWFWRALSFAAVDIIKFGFYYPVLFAGLAVSAIYARRREWTPRETAFAGLVLVLFFASLFDFGRPNRYRLQFQAPLFNAVLVYLLWQLSLARRRAALALTGIVVVSFLGNGLHNLLSWSAYRYPVDFPRGRFYYEDPRVAARLRQLTGLITGLVPRGTPVYAFPQQNLLPWLMAYPNPTRNIESIPVLHERPDFHELKRQIEERRVDWLLYTPIDPALGGDYPTVSREEFATEQNFARDLFIQGFELVLETPSASLYRRK